MLGQSGQVGQCLPALVEPFRSQFPAPFSTSDWILSRAIGQATFYVGDDRIQAGTGSSVTLPRGIPHWFSIDSEEIRWLNVITPAGFEQFFRDLGEPAREAALPPPSDQPLDIPNLIATAQEYGCEILPPEAS